MFHTSQLVLTIHIGAKQLFRILDVHLVIKSKVFNDQVKRDGGNCLRKP